MRFSTRGWIAPLVAALALATANCFAEGIDDAGIIGGLADMGDMEPLAGAGGWADAAATAGDVRASVRANVRQSVPARDRAASYRSGELFRNSKAALPLLVADLEPRLIAVAQPMSGRSVGARPAAAWTRSAAAPVAVSPTRGRQPATWAASGR